MVDPDVSLPADLLQGLAGLRGPWGVGGDWNLEAADLQEWARLAQGVALAPSEPTRGGRCPDFFAVSRVPAGLVKDVGAILGPLTGARAPARLRARVLLAQAKTHACSL